MNYFKSGSLALILLLAGICGAEGLVDKDAPVITVRKWVTPEPPDIKKLTGKVRVLEFWATWCHPCVENIPHLIELNEKYSSMGLEFISLSQDRSVEKVRKFVKEKKINYHVAVDNGTTDWYGIRGYPTAVVINHSGKVTWVGYPWKEEFEEAISKALKSCPPAVVAGIDLGPYERYKDDFRGGKGFQKIYSKIKTDSLRVERGGDSAVAKRIISVIDTRISRQIGKADRLCDEDPARAYRLYAEIVTKYDGAADAARAKAGYLKFKKQQQSEK